MIEERIKNLCQVDYESRIMIMDRGDLDVGIFDCEHFLTGCGYRVIRTVDNEWLRYLYETQIKGTKNKYAVLLTSGQVVPYDIQKAFYQVELSLAALYPRLDPMTLKEYPLDLELIDFSYDDYFGKRKDSRETQAFIKHQAFSKEAITRYLRYAEAFHTMKAKAASSWEDWLRIAKTGAALSYYAAANGNAREDDEANEAFQTFLMDGYQKLSSISSKYTPSILPKTWDLIAKSKTALIVMDGMSLFDFEVFRRSDWPFQYNYGASFALIPTITSVSRQALIAGKYPSQLENPFYLSKEESGFYAAAAEHGFSKNNAYYGRGYEADPGPFARLAVIVINDIDDMVHGQLQGRQGMLQDVQLLSKTGKLQALIRRLMDQGFTVYMTADHGNTECIGTGALKRSGVETETKSRRMIVLKDYGEASEDLRARTIQFPGYYLDKSYQYFICKDKTSFDGPGKQVMTHGGMTIDEVIVPFIRITGE